MNFLRSFIRFSLQESQRDIVPLEKINKSFEKKNKSLPFSEKTIELISRIPDTDLNQLSNRKGFIKWLANEVEKMSPQPDRTEIRYVIDYINGTSKTIESLETFNDVFYLSGLWHQELAQKQNDDVEHREGAQVVFDFKNGFKLVDLEQCDLDAEGNAMGHCVGSYDLSKGKRILSLRDARNKPHVTVEIENGKVEQIKGKQNEPPIEKYASMIRQWLKTTDLDYATEDYFEIATTEELEKFSNNNKIILRAMVAASKNATKEILIKLSKDENEGVREFVAFNPNTPKEILLKFADDKNYFVRRGLAGNKNAPKEVLIKLSNDENKDVIEALAANLSTPKEVLVKFSNDKNGYVRREVAQNPNTPKEVLIKFSNDEDRILRAMVAANLSTPKEILIKLCEDKYEYVRQKVVANPNAPKEVLIKLSKDEDTWTRVRAKKALLKFV